MSCQDIGLKYNCSRVHIYNLCIRYGIKLKTKSESRADAKSTGKEVRYNKVNKDFFKKWSSEMAYVLGFIYTDGCINGRCSFVSMAQKEVEILEKIKKMMQADQKIFKYKHQDIHYLNIGCAEIVNDLLRLGVTPAKSLTIQFPQVPNEYVGSFIRGIFDGDGCISHASGNTWRAKFVSGSMDFISGIKGKIEMFSGVTSQKISTAHTQLNKEFYSLSYQRKVDIVKLLEFMYDKYSIDNGIYLTRKYLKFKEALGHKCSTENDTSDSSGLATNEIEKQSKGEAFLTTSLYGWQVS